MLFAWQAVQEASRKFEHEASKLLWEFSGSVEEINKAVAFVVKMETLFEAEITQFKTGNPAGGPTPPKCGPGFHEEDGMCVANG